MRTGFFFGLAKDGIRKNSRMYVPYILSCVSMVAMYFILVSLQYQKTLLQMFGGGTLAKMMKFGSVVVAIFSVLFLFYTNAFFMRKRKKEFGLYHILGMGKRHISRILLWESLIVAVVSLGGGMLVGLLFSKLAELGLLNIMRVDVNYEFYLIPQTFSKTFLIYGILFLALFLNAIRQIRFSNTVSLLASEKTGEKPPKANWLLAVSGVVCLAAAYIICLKIVSPIAALTSFTFAVILVIVGTYLVFIASSVLFCKLLQKNKNYYYRTNHFVSVSSMIYRMKRNGAGLASICILATMVLVIVSSTSCLYLGVDDVMKKRYPRDVNMSFKYENIDSISMENVEEFSKRICEAAKSTGATVDNEMVIPYVPLYGYLEGNYVTLNVDSQEMKDTDAERIISIYLVPVEVYNQYMGKNTGLADGEALACYSQLKFKYSEIELEEAGKISIKETVKKVPPEIDFGMRVTPTITLFVNDIGKTLGNLVNIVSVKNNNRPIVDYHLDYCFDNGLDKDKQQEFSSEFNLKLAESGVTSDKETVNPATVSTASYDFNSISIEYGAIEKDGYFEIMGGLFYMGIILSIVFLFATVLIIYYKQISEGYEDQARFEIMQKVGMTKKEIRSSINSQMLTVFFFPLLLAGIHICFAFPIIRKLLLLFMLNNVTLFAIICIVCFVIFALFYMLVYRFTSNAYYRIVSGVDNK